jgi:SAM-dependent methyltransferase
VSQPVPGSFGTEVLVGASALSVYGHALATGHDLVLQMPGGRRVHSVRRWLAEADAVDRRALARCTGPTLDVGCGPGRLTAALAARGIAALGVDISARAVHLARSRGAVAIRRDVFAPLPGEARWSWALLLDGNIGIGGRPERLLRRIGELVRRGGCSVVEVCAEDIEVSGSARIAVDGVVSRPFPWAELGASGLARAAATTGWRPARTWDDGGRRFVLLSRT